MDRTLECLTDWLPQQRWYIGKGRMPRLSLAGDLPLAEGVRILLVADESTLPPTVYQIPVVIGPAGGDDDHAIGSPEPGRVLFDGPHHPAFTGALFERLISGRDDDAIRTSRLDASPPPPALPVARVLGGEQSNTSIVFTDAAAPPAAAMVCKVYRVVRPGTNPDVEVQSALTRAGSSHVPAVIASLEGGWTTGPDQARQRGTLAFAQVFVADGADGWELALRAASAREDFTSRAALLGTTTAAVHASLAAAFGTVPSTPDRRATIVAAWRRRLEEAIAELPELAAHRLPIERLYLAASAAPWPDLQRIHGDFHLGQALHSATRGWVLLDFEGEPLRPYAERDAPDLALRDVAGMLRSFDYVAGSIEMTSPGQGPEALRAWAAAAQTALLTSYAQATEVETTDLAVLLRALEVDKAVYEAVYEARSRPSWTPIPLRAIERLAPAQPAA